MNVERSAPRGAVFLSYASQDTEAAKRIADALRAAGVVVWFDQGELVGGDAWDQKIRKQIGGCALFVPLISASTQARAEGYFRLEWRLADKRTELMGRARVFLLPVCIDDTRDSEADVPDSFLAVQWTKLPGGKTSAAFCERVKTLLAPPTDSSRTRFMLRDETIATSPAPAASAPAKQKYSPWLTALIVIVPLIVGLVIVWRVVPHSSGKPEKPNAAAPVAVTPATGPRAEAKQLVANAWEQLNRTGLSRAGLEIADDLCQQAAALDPGSADVWAAWAQVEAWHVYGNLEDTPERRESARTKSARAMKLDPQSFEARLAEACYLLRATSRSGVGATNEFYASAEQTLRTLLRERENDPRVYFALGILLRNSGRYAEGAAMFDRMAVLPGSAATALNEKGWLLRFAGDFRGALEADDRSIAAQPIDGNLMLRLMLALYWTGDLDAAQAAVALIPPSILTENNGLSGAVAVFRWRREPEAMLRLLNAAPRTWLASNIFIGPRHFLIGVAQRMAGKEEAAQLAFREALRVVEQRLEKEPDSAELLWMKARVLCALGRRTDAEAAARLATSVGPVEDWEALIELGYFDRAFAYLEHPRASQSFLLNWASLKLNPAFDPLRNAPRFQALLARAEADPARCPHARRPTADAANPVASSPDPKSVVVLPFANLSGDPAQEYFSDGLTEEILNALARERDLRVVPRTSAFSFKGKNLPLPEIARVLNVAQVVEGSVRRAGNMVRIDCTLTRVSDGFAQPLPQFQREMKDASGIFALEDEVARAVVEKLTQRTTTTAPVAVLTKNPDAYDAYLRGRLLQTRGAQFRIEAAARYKQAVTLDPTFALAWARLAAATFRDYSGLYDRGPELIAKSREAIDRALTVEPDLAEALIMRANWRREVHGDFDAARRDLQRAEAIQPATAEFRFAQTLLARDTGNWSEALRRARETLELDPLNGDYTNTLAVNLYWPQGDFVQADRLFARAMAIQGPSSALPLNSRTALRTVWRGSAATLQLLKQAPAGQAGLDALRLRALVSLGRIDEAKLIVNAMEREAAATLGGANALFAAGNGAVWAEPYLHAVGRDDLAGQLAEEARSKAVQSIQHGNRAPYIYAWLVQDELTLGHREAALSALEEWRRESKQAPGGFRRLHEFNRLAIPLYAALGRVEEVAALLGECAAAGYHVDFSIRDDIRFSAIRGDPRLQAIIREMEGWAKAQPDPNEP